MRERDLITINYRPIEMVEDLHGNKVKQFNTVLHSIIGTVRPELLTTDIKNVGSRITGNILVYVPKNKNYNFNVKQGDGFYLDGDDTDEKPTWFVSNVPFPYIKHYVLVLKNKVE